MSNPAGESNDTNYRWHLLGVVMIGTLMSALDASIVNVSIPAIMADFGSSLDDIEWVVTSYMLAFASLMPLTAWLRDRMGHKWLYVAALLVFTLGSVLCGVAWNLPTLILARVVQAAGGAAITPTGMAMITEVFEPRERGKALGFWGMGAVMGPAFGPTVGGYLTKYFGWPSIFLVNLPIGILGVALALKVIRSDKPHASVRRPFDAWGFVFLALFLVFFLLGTSKGESEGWTSSYVLTCAGLAAVGLTGFLLVESLIDHGIMDLSLFRNSVFSACFLLTSVRSIALYGGTFLLPVFLQRFKGLDELESGLLMLPGSLLMAMLMPFAGRLSDRISPRILGMIGFSLLGFFFFQYHNLSIETSNWGVVGPTMIRAFGMAILIAPLTATAMNSIPMKKAGMASSMLNIIQQVGGSIGIAVLSLVLHRRSSYHLDVVGSAVNTQSVHYREALTRLVERAHDVGYGHVLSLVVAQKTLGSHIAKQAGVFAFQDAFLVGSGITFVALFCVFLLPSKPLSLAKKAEPVHLE